MVLEKGEVKLIVTTPSSGQRECIHIEYIDSSPEWSSR